VTYPELPSGGIETVSHDLFLEDKRADFGPWQSEPRLAILVQGEGRSLAEIAGTSADLLWSSFQNYSVSVSGAAVGGIDRLAEWLGEDRRFVFRDHQDPSVPAARFILVLPAGWRLTRYSLEALLAAVQLPGVSVVRALVEGARKPLEIWERDFLVANGVKSATRIARLKERERWLDGSSLGLHAHGHDAPKVFFRKGHADRHILEFVVHDSMKEAFRQTQRNRIKLLEREIRNLNSQLRSPSGMNGSGKFLKSSRLVRAAKRSKIGQVVRLLRDGQS
jgi:hypothetical protein